MIVQIQQRANYYYSAGKAFNPELPTLVFIHGAQNDHSVWALQSRYFAYHGYNVIAVDLPGHGRSVGPALNTVEAMSAWLVQLLDAIGVQKTALAGHSMGSLIALDVARSAPQRVSKLLLLGNAYPMKVADALLTMARDDEPAAIAMVCDWSHLNRMQSTPNPGYNLQNSAQKLMQRMSDINPEQLFFNDFSACNNYKLGEDAATAVNSAQIPTLFVVAKQDKMTPGKASLSLRNSITGCKTTEINNCGHSMMTEQPDQVLKAMQTFLR